MRIRLDVLLKPIDPVVAIHHSTRAADDALALLQRAGFRRSDLTVVGEGNSTAPVSCMVAHRRGAASRWARSGLGLGVLWAAFVSIAVVAQPAGGAGFAALATMGTLTVLLQAAVVRHVLAPHMTERTAQLAATTVPANTARSVPGWRFLVVVHGSRSDVALARTLLTMA